MQIKLEINTFNNNNNNNKNHKSPFSIYLGTAYVQIPLFFVKLINLNEMNHHHHLSKFRPKNIF